MSRILKVEHWEPRFEYNDASFFRGRGDSVEELRIFAGQTGPDPAGYDLVIVYGGYMSAYDDARHPWIADELRFLERCLESGTQVLGICLGSQLLARALGAKVYASPRPEFGFRRISLGAAGLADPALGALGGTGGDFLAIEWHDDAWDLPAGAELLASSAAWPNQAFRYGPAILGLQFHLEFTQPHMAWAVSRPDEPVSADPEGEDRAVFSNPSPRYEEIGRNMALLLESILEGTG